MTQPLTPYIQGIVPPSTIVPQNKDLFVPYFTRLYENLATAINNKDPIFFTIPITDTPTDIPNIANFGAFTICVSGFEQDDDLSWPPTIIAALCKSSDSVAGSIAVLGSQAGQGPALTTWLAATLTITSTATNFQINHSVSNVTGNFNIKIIGTQ